MTMTTATAHDPLTAGSAARAWWLAETVARLAMWAAWAAAMYGAGTVNRALTAGSVVVMLALLVVSRRLSREAWSFVPGAFAWRSVLRGDDLEVETPAAVAMRRWVEAAVLITLAYLVVSRVGEYGQVGLGMYLAIVGGFSLARFGTLAANPVSIGRLARNRGSVLAVGIGLVAVPTALSLPPGPAYYTPGAVVGIVVALLLRLVSRNER